MFGSFLIDVGIGVILVFLLVSLVSSAVTEAISAVLMLRHNTLRRGVQALLNDPDFTGLAKQLYNHALISPFGSGAAKTVSELVHPPAYITPRQFGLALSDILQAGVPGSSSGDMITAIKDPQLQQTVRALQERANRVGTHLSDELAAWFDCSMDRVSGWYKRRAQWISFFTALALAAILNADIIHVAAALWDRPVFAAGVARLAPDTMPKLPDLLLQMEQQNSLIGWQVVGAYDGLSMMLRLLGWLITAAATLFGAAFWFDLLQKFVQVRATGMTPDEKVPACVLASRLDMVPRPSGDGTEPVPLQSTGKA